MVVTFSPPVAQAPVPSSRGLVQAPRADHSTQLFGETRTSAAQAASGIVNDWTGLHPVRPAEIRTPKSAADVQSAMAYARARGLGLTAAGTRHAQGGQALRAGGVLLDMRGMDRMRYDAASESLIVQPGATWDAVQRYLDTVDRSVAVQQTSNIFSVGGSVSVNAHGRDVRFGPIVDSVRSVDVVLPDGRLVTTGRASNPELFSQVIGGYGLFGTVVQIELGTVPNEVYRRHIDHLPTSGFADWYDTNVTRNPNARLMEARLSTDPDHLFDSIYGLRYDADPSLKDVDPHSLPPLTQHEASILAFLEKGSYRLASRTDAGQRLMWLGEKFIEPVVTDRITTRNQAMSPPLEFARSGPSSHSQLLQEYFVPQAQLPQLIDSLRTIATKHDANLLYAGIRAVRADTTTALPYAKGDSFGVVLVMDEPATAEGQADIAAMTREAGGAAARLGGSFYLPYLLPYTAKEMSAAYSGFANLIAAHRRVDPSNMLANGITDLAQRIGL